MIQGGAGGFPVLSALLGKCGSPPSESPQAVHAIASHAAALTHLLTVQPGEPIGTLRVEALELVVAVFRMKSESEEQILVEADLLPTVLVCSV